jgi:hypothetical protein
VRRSRPCLRVAAGAVALHQEQLALAGVRAAAVGSLPGRLRRWLTGVLRLHLALAARLAWRARAEMMMRATMDWPRLSCVQPLLERGAHGVLDGPATSGC